MKPCERSFGLDAHSFEGKAVGFMKLRGGMTPWTGMENCSEFLRGLPGNRGVLLVYEIADAASYWGMNTE